MHRRLSYGEPLEWHSRNYYIIRALADNFSEPLVSLSTTARPALVLPD